MVDTPQARTQIQDDDPTFGGTVCHPTILLAKAAAAAGRRSTILSFSTLCIASKTSLEKE